MARLIYTYQCEWAEVVKNPSRRSIFQQFANSSDTTEGIEYITERGQRRPADWPKEFSEEPAKDEIKVNPGEKAWIKIAKLDHFPEDAGQVVKYGDVQIAIYNTHKKTQWYATQNMCPHKRAFVLSQGIVGDENGTIKVSCPMHKKNFALETGECLSGDVNLRLMTFDIKVEDDHIWLHLPPTHELDRLLGTSKWKVTKNGKKEKERIMDRTATKIQMLGITNSSGCADVSCGDKKLDW